MSYSVSMQSYVFAGIAERGETSGYGLYFPDLPGCVTAGETLEELVANAHEALQLHLEGMTDAGYPIPDPTPIERLPHDPEVQEVGVTLISVTLAGSPTDVSLKLPAKLLQRIDQAAGARGLTRNDFIAQGAEALLKAS
jgi:predicted RNase H-like HicB family nuclease